MGTITNLATTGIYTFETENLKVTFNFNINNETKATRITDGRIYEDEALLCTFNAEPNGNISAWGIPRGRGVDCAHAWESAIAQFETKLVEGAME